MNILIPNVGRRGYLVRYLKATEGFEGRVFVSDCDTTASGLYGNNDGAFILPRPVDDEEKYVQLLIDLCKKESINVIIPVIDPEISIISKHTERFKESNLFVSVSNSSVLETCYNKLKMNEFLINNGFNIPATFDNIKDFENAFNNNRISFPLIIKPIYGSGSEATYKANSMDEVYALFKQGMIIQEFINGDEYGIDVFNNLNGEPLRCVVKKKISMRSGETDKAVSVKDKSIQETLIKLAKDLGHICNLDVDVLKQNDKIYIIDLNPRFGGGYPATHESGVNLLSLIIKLAEGKYIEPVFNDYNDGVFTFKEVNIITTTELVWDDKQ